MAKSFLAGAGAIWVQPDGPNSQPYFLGCHALGDIERPRGDATLVFIPDVEHPNNFIPLDIYASGGPGPVSTTIESVIKSAADWLESVNCPMPIYINQVLCGRQDVFDNWDRAFILDKAIVTSESLSGMVIMSADDQDRSMQSFDVSAKLMHRLFPLSTGSQNIISVAGQTGLSVAFSGSRKCYGQCGNVHSANQDGYLGVTGLIGSPTNLYYTDDGGLVWFPTATNPFQSHEDVSGVVDVQIAKNSYRVIVTRGTLDGLNPAEIAYSDDRGATFTNVNVGAVNGQYAIGTGQPLFAWNGSNIWLVTTGGYIYFSKDAGITWTAQESGATTTQNLHSVYFVDDKVGFAVGDNNAILRTTDGENWSALTGPAAENLSIAQAVFAFDRNRIWIGYDSGNLYFSNDGGDSWFERSYPGSGTGEIQSIQFCNEYVGYISHISTGGATGSLFRTINGGWSWITQSLPSGTGALYDIHVTNCNNIYVAGDL